MVTSALELLVKAMLKIIMISSLYSAILLFGTGVPNDSLDILPNKSMYESTKKRKIHNQQLKFGNFRCIDQK